MNRYALPVGGHKPSKLPPLRTFKEMAEEFGITMGTLRRYFATTQVTPPQPINKCRASSSDSQSTWYNPIEMRAWWKAHNEQRKTDAPAV